MLKPKSSIDTRLVRELAQVLSDTDLTEIEIEAEGLKIRVARQVTVQAMVASHAPAMAPAAAMPAAQSAAAPAPAAPIDDPRKHPGVVTSPMVGTAYRRPSPDSKPLIEVGQVVKEGDRLLLIEAMKTFNDIVAPRGGTITSILFDDGRPVEYGEPLLIIE